MSALPRPASALARQGGRRQRTPLARSLPLQHADRWLKPPSCLSLYRHRPDCRVCSLPGSTRQPCILLPPPTHRARRDLRRGTQRGGNQLGERSHRTGALGWCSTTMSREIGASEREAVAPRSLRALCVALVRCDQRAPPLGRGARQRGRWLGALGPGSPHTRAHAPVQIKAANLRSVECTADSVTGLVVARRCAAQRALTSSRGVAVW